MNMFHKMKYLVSIIILLTSFSCGQYAGNNDYAGGGIGGTGISGVSVGKVTAIDLTNSSISVNGVSFSLNGTGITVNGTTADIANLKVGMIVKVNGEFDKSGDTGKALTVEFEDNIEGPVDTGSKDLSTNSFKVLGKTIIVDPIVDTGTKFEKNDSDATFDDLNEGDVVEVSGFEDSNGFIHATYIEIKQDTYTPGITHVELKGTISNVNKDENTFVLNNITITYNDSQIDDSVLTDNINIEVKGIININDNHILIAIKVELHDTTPTVKEGEKVEIEGYITEITSFTESTVDFKINNQIVHVDNSYTNIKISAIQPGIKIEVKGTIESGILNATKISIETDEHKKNDEKKVTVEDTNTQIYNSNINNSTIDNANNDDQNVTGQDISVEDQEDANVEDNTTDDTEGDGNNDTVDSDNIEEEEISQSDTEDEHQGVDEIETEQKDEEDK